MPATGTEIWHTMQTERRARRFWTPPWLGHTSVLLHLACCLVTPGGMMLPSQALNWVPP